MWSRRRFLELFGAGVAGIALEQVIPFGRVWSFPKSVVIGPPVVLPELTVRFIRAWDPAQSMLLSRVDMLYGFATLYPDGTVPVAEQHLYDGMELPTYSV